MINSRERVLAEKIVRGLLGVVEEFFDIVIMVTIDLDLWQDEQRPATVIMRC